MAIYLKINNLFIQDKIFDFLQTNLTTETIKKVESDYTHDDDNLLIIEDTLIKDYVNLAEHLDNKNIIILTQNIFTADNSLINNFFIVYLPLNLIALQVAIQSWFDNKKQVFKNQDICIKSTLEESYIFYDANPLEKVMLTYKESTLLKELLQHYPEPLNKSYLLKKIWNMPEDTNSKTLETHISNIRKKLEISNLNITIVKNLDTCALKIKPDLFT